jgi:signal peptide peptidase SppA
MDTRIEAVTNSLWAIRPEAVPLVLARLAGITAPAFLGVAWEAAKPTTIGARGNKIAVIPVQGVLSKDGPSYYGSNYDGIASALETAAGDSEVRHIVLSVDSPGGQVTGLPETAAVVAQVAKVKPVTAMVEGTSASAAYWLTSQAGDVVLTPSGEVGSVGVRMMHVDISQMLEKAGYKVTELYSGNFKTEWSPFKPLSEEAAADMQDRLEATHADFINAVSAGRGNRVSAEATANRFGEGRMFSSDAAKANGLVDSVQASRDFYRAIMPPQETAPAFGLPRAAIEVARLRVQA